MIMLAMVEWKREGRRTVRSVTPLRHCRGKSHSMRCLRRPPNGSYFEPEALSLPGPELRPTGQASGPAAYRSYYALYVLCIVSRTADGRWSPAGSHLRINSQSGHWIVEIESTKLKVCSIHTHSLPLPHFQEPSPQITVMGRSLGTDLLFFEALYTIFPFPTRQHAYRAVVLVAMIYLAAQIYLAQGDSNSVWMEHVAGFTVASHFMFVAYLLLAEGSFEFPNHWRRVRDETKAGDNPGSLDNLPSNFPLTKKVWWMLDIAWGMRMIGWVQEPRSYAPPRPPPSRRTFLQRTFLKFVTNTIIGDLATSAFALNPAFDHRLHDPTDGPETYLAAVPLLHRVPYVLSWATGARARLSARHNAIALLCVGLGNSSPTLWPDIWGSWGDSYTVRGLFGYANT